MKKLTNLLSITIVAVLFIFATSCTKEGPAGPAGTNGTNGENGINGTDGTTTCIECHSNNQVIFAKEIQWAASIHATGGNFERNTGECAICHTSQGFLGNLDGTYDWEAPGAMISNPNPQNCYTCHKIHETYTPADLALTVTGAVTLRNTGGATYDFGKGSLCASCHQGRTIDPFPTEGGPDITVTSAYWGIHHGPQANTFSGMGYVEFGTVTTTNPHQIIENACVTCHMAEAYGVQAGGHTMFMAYEYHGGEKFNFVSCDECHSDAVGDFDALEIEVDGLFTDLKVLLDSTGITEAGSDRPIPGTYSGTVAGAFVNYKGLTEDRSFGVHNPAYVRSLLNNTIVALQ